jgi:2,4-dienoyl-CoA reductase-like NADH-dependent reductase (Old Yellow Enzyme family)
MLDGAPPVSASAITAPGYGHSYRGKLEYDQPRALRLDEMPRIVDDYGHAARNAKAAGFDGVQLHGANGYLIEQFLRRSTNTREDAYGGSPENRCRLMGEVLERLVDVWGAGRVSVRLSPNSGIQGCEDPDPAPVFLEAARVLQMLNIGFLELRQPGPDGTFGTADVPRLSPAMREIYKGPVVLNADYDPARADAEIREGLCEAVSFGRPYISNPDLAARIRAGKDLAPNIDAPQSWYSPGPAGYTDYPTMDAS